MNKIYYPPFILKHLLLLILKPLKKKRKEKIEIQFKCFTVKLNNVQHKINT